MFSSTLKHTLQFKSWFLTIQHSKDVCPIIAYCVTEFESHILTIFVLPQIAQNKNTCQIHVFYSNLSVLYMFFNCYSSPLSFHNPHGVPSAVPWPGPQAQTRGAIVHLNDCLRPSQRGKTVREEILPCRKCVGLLRV